MHYCLNKDELLQLIEFKLSNKGVDENLKLRIENSISWEDELCCLNYFLSRILEMKLQKKVNCKKIISLIYELENEMSFCIQELDLSFIQNLLRNDREASLSLDQELIDLQNNLGAHIYD